LATNSRGLISRVKQSFSAQDNKAKIKVQVGAGRLADNILGLAEAYREARQALIISSMIRGNEEFVIDYGALG